MRGFCTREAWASMGLFAQAHEEGYVRVLPPVGRTVKVAFYSGSCDSLAHSRPLLQAMLRVCSKPRAGTYRCFCCTHQCMPFRE